MKAITITRNLDGYLPYIPLEPIFGMFSKKQVAEKFNFEYGNQLLLLDEAASLIWIK